MTQNSDLIIKVIISILISFGLVKIFSPLLKEWVEKLTGTKTKRRSLDEMIESKKRQFSANPSPTTSQSSIKVHPSSRSSTVEAYRKALADSSNKSLQSEYESVIKLFHSLQWGTCELYHLLAGEIEEQLGTTVTQNDIVQILQRLDKEKTLLSLLVDTLPPYKEVKKVISSFLLLEKLHQGFILTSLDKFIPQAFHPFIQDAVSIFIDKKITQNSKFDYHRYMEDHESIPGHSFHGNLKILLIHKDRKSFRTYHQLLNEIENESRVLFTLNPISEDTLDSIQVPELKALRASCHPDKISQQGVSDDLLEVVTRNFQTIHEYIQSL